MASKKNSGKVEDWKAQLQAVQEMIPLIESRIDEIHDFQERLNTISSVTEGLYEEVDKLCKKAPAERATDLLVSEANEVIKEIVPLATNDAPLQRIKQFVPAGDNPEYRDVLLVLRLIRQGVNRLSTNCADRLANLESDLRELNGLDLVLIWLVNGEKPSDITPEVLRSKRLPLSEKWFTDFDDGTYFDVEEINRLSIKEHFGR